MTRDEVLTWAFIVEILDALDKNGYLPASDQHASRAADLIGDLARIYHDVKAAVAGPGINGPPSPSQAAAGPQGTGDGGAVPAGDPSRVRGAPDQTSGYRCDRAAAYAEGAGPSDSRATLMPQAAQASQAAPASQPAQRAAPGIWVPPQAAADLEAGQ